MNFVKTRNSKIIAGLLLLLLLATLVEGCKQEKAKEMPATAIGEQIPVYSIGDAVGDWGYPSPFLHNLRGPGYIRMSFIFDTLVWKDENGLVPALANRWEYIESENAYLFELNDLAKWHDGTNFTAKDVVFTFDYLKKHPYGLVEVTKIDKVEAVSNNTVKIYLTEKYSPFLNSIAGVTPILPEHIWKDVDKPHEFSAPEAVIGTGPYKLLDYNKEQGTYLYEGFEDYYLGKPVVKQLRFLKVGKEMAAAALERGEVHYTQIPPDLKDQLTQKNLEVLKTKYDWVLKLLINHQKEPFADKEFRHALAYALDRQELVDTALRGLGLAGSQGLLSPDSEWYNQGVNQYPFNSEKARQIFARYSLQPIELLIIPDYEREGQYIKQKLEEVGLKVNLVSLEGKTLDSRVNDWNFDLALSGHGALDSDAEVLNRMILGKSFVSARYNTNQELTGLLKEQLTVTNEEERKKKVQEIQTLYAEELPCVSLYYPDWYFGHDGQIDLFNTKKGIGPGVPLPLNKSAFVTVGTPDKI